MEIKSGDQFTNKRNFGQLYYAKYRDRWFKTLAYYFRPHARTKKKIKAKIIRIMGKGQREFDYGNFIQGAKPIPDFLQKIGLIWNDSPNWFDCEYQQKRLNEIQKAWNCDCNGILLQFEYYHH